MRGRFAMRLADYRDEDGSVSRLGGVRDAFNSPFKPFVLATTSIGRERARLPPLLLSRVPLEISPAIRSTSSSGKDGAMLLPGPMQSE